MNVPPLKMDGGGGLDGNEKTPALVPQISAKTKSPHLHKGVSMMITIISQDRKHSVGKDKFHRIDIFRHGKEIIAEKDGERILLGRYTKTERSCEIFQKLCLVIRQDIPNCGDFFYMPRY